MTTKTQAKITPVGARVLLQRLEAEETLKGGIILPDSAKKKQEMATVIAVGTPKKDDEPIQVKIGDSVLIDKYSGQDITVDDEEFVVVKAEDIIAIVE
ncbi:MAG: 10 kDa chaperonin 5 [Chlamydiia bacterium]|nr:10 kDa chaperonin 5 [Chlamydiia bacterium]MCH9615898.1 10 kDa chaperonin 5 [Chlamydiia bacterium]MCH9628699.1 10 kDa chaperonin 5 [Chlamydiia bacterium]